MIKKPFSDLELQLWSHFAAKHGLNQKQIEQFHHYYRLLTSINEYYNITTITELSSVLSLHFDDSLALSLLVDCQRLATIGDIGTGGGFPGIPLKIVYPHLHVILIEVVHKKIRFLSTVIQELQLDNITIVDSDWRTFLRKTDYPIELFCARASLHPAELIRVFKPASPYKNALLVYWASQQWNPTPQEAFFITEEQLYTLDDKQRKLVMFML